MSNEMIINDSLNDWSRALDRLIKHIQQNIADTKLSISEGLKNILGTVPEEPEDFFISQDALNALLNNSATPQ
ncbi:hypothetical protein MHK_005463 [Candidatus Magnetomorum sp. HK-1]|nr:hypothetical protein MHK_005463 [Candidatus Magnetomorum sp. HK-1]